MKRYILGFVTISAILMAGCQGCDNSTAAKSGEMNAINKIVDGQLETLRADLKTACMEDVVAFSDSVFTAQTAVKVKPKATTTTTTTTTTPPPAVINPPTNNQGNVDGTNVGTSGGKKQDGTKTGTTTGKKKDN